MIPGQHLERIDEFVTELTAGGATLLEVGAVVNSMSDHGHLTRIFDRINKDAAPSVTLGRYFTALAAALRDKPVSDDAVWAAQRVMASQAVSMGTVAMSNIGDLRGSYPTERPVVASVFDSVTGPHREFICDEVIRNGLMLDGSSPREEYWPEVLSLGRYFRALGDIADNRAYDEHGWPSNG